MANFIGISLKRTNEVDLVKPLKNLFSSYCISADEPVQYDNALSELNKLRMNATWRTLDKHESSLEAMAKYYDQLGFLEAKCPTAEFPVAFKWKDAFDKGSLFMGSASLTLSSLAYERICILFNLGAMQSQIAVAHGNDIRNDEGLKLAAKYFQLASGTFMHLKSLVADLHHDPTPDLQPDTLAALHAIMLGQAQESFCYKAIAGNMKEHVIARVASQCEELFADALKLMQKEPTRVVWEKEWMALMAGKQAGFYAIAEYYQSLVCKTKKEFGEELSRLKHSSELLKLAEIRSGMNLACCKDYINKVAFAYEESKKDNDFIYHARIPEIKTLPPVEKAALAKATAVSGLLSQNSQDLFTNLLPMPVQQALQAFETRKIELINMEKTRVQSQTQLLNGILASLNLPAALEDTTGDDLPQSLRDKAQAVRDKGGFEVLQKSFQELPDLLQRNKEILSECTRMLNDEEESDNNLRSQFKNNWRRTPSARLNEPLKANVEKYNKIMSNAVNADGIVHEKFNVHKDKIIMLCQPECFVLQSGEELLSHIPKGSPVIMCNSGEHLKGLMDQVKELLNERKTLKEELESATIDMKAKFLSALSEDGSINEQTISTIKLDEIYAPIQARIQINLDRQEKIVEDIQRVNTEFCKEKDIKQSVADRETVLKELAAAHDVYIELSGNLEEGTKFYNNLTQILVAFQNKISDFCFARKTEREELCKELQTNIVTEANKQPAPVAPAHHDQNTKPARPPPPKTTASYVPPSMPYPTATNAPSGPYPMAAQAVNTAPYPTYPAYPPPYPYPTLPTAHYPYPQQMGSMPYVAAPGYQAQPQLPVQPDQYQTGGYPYPQQQYYHQQWHQ